MNSAVSEQGKKTVVGQIATEPSAGSRPVVIYFTDIFIVALFEEYAPLIIRMNHKYPPPFLSLSGRRVNPLFPDCIETDINTDMTSHPGDKPGFIRVKKDFSVIFTAYPALTAIFQDGVQGTCTKLLHLKCPIFSERVVYKEPVGPFGVHNTDPWSIGGKEAIDCGQDRPFKGYRVISPF
jgi:hypothetical protein